MEHLIYHPPSRDFRREVRNIVIGLERGKLTLADDEADIPCPPVFPCVPWLGHDHEDSSYYGSDNLEPVLMTAIFFDYGEDWEIQKAFASDDPDPRSAHESFSTLDDADVAHQVVAFVQSWFFFGLLEAMCGCRVPVEFFTRDDGEKEWIYTRRLPAFLEGWKRSLGHSKLDDEARDSLMCDARECALHARSLLGDFLKEPSEHENTSIRYEIWGLLGSIAPALYTLHDAIISFVSFHVKSRMRYSYSLDESPAHQLYIERLVEKGWCPFILANADTAMPPSFLLYVDAMGFTHSSSGHEKCTPTECKRNNIDEETYTQVHTRQNCKCRFVKPNITAIYTILDEGMVPVVQYHEKQKALEVAAFTPNAKARCYIAFSHVWADGLGSYSEKGLPTCQLKRLQSLAAKVDDRIAPWFWIDGICVPEERYYRRKAIEVMYMTYRGAIGVGILDSGIIKLSRSCSAVEIGWAVLSSGWFGRMWTYLEGFAPQRAYLLLSDGKYNLYDLIQELRKMQNYDGCNNPFPSVFLREFLSYLQKARPIDYKHRERATSRRMIYTYNALTNRSTSKPDDQIYVIGLTLDMDIPNLSAVIGEERWRRLYLSLREIPWTIVFDQRPKMTSQPFRWAPRSWLGPSGAQWLGHEDALAICTDAGLRVKTTVLRLDDACDVQLRELLIEVHGEFGTDSYELSRETTSISALEKISLSKFNVIFIRYFGYDSPEDSLKQNGSVLLSDIGLGYEDPAGTKELEYSFAKVWNIQYLDDEELEACSRRLNGVPRVSGEWEDGEFCFT